MELLLSTGLSSFVDIYRALECLSTARIKKITLLRCVTEYPADPTTYGIAILRKYRDIFHHGCGLSDHSIDPFLLPSIAIAFGSTMTEKHFTLSHDSSSCPDDPIALVPKQYAQMVEMISRMHTLYKRKGSTAVLRNLGKRYGKDLIDTIVGKKGTHRSRSAALFPHYFTSRRSLCASRDIAEGEPFGTHNISLLRSEQNMRPGMDPNAFAIVCRTRCARALQKGSPLHYEHLLFRL